MIKKITKALTLVACFVFYSTASASYIFDIYDNSSTDIGTLGFTSLTGTDTLTGIFQADISLGGVDFTLPNLLPSTWTITGVSNEILTTGEFFWGSPTYGPYPTSFPTTDVGYTIQVNVVNNQNGSLFGYGYCPPPSCEDEFVVVTDGWFEGAPYSLRAVPEPATLALFGIGLAGLGFARKKKKSA